MICALTKATKPLFILTSCLSHRSCVTWEARNLKSYLNDKMRWCSVEVGGRMKVRWRETKHVMPFRNLKFTSSGAHLWDSSLIYLLVEKANSFLAKHDAFEEIRGNSLGSKRHALPWDDMKKSFPSFRFITFLTNLCFGSSLTTTTAWLEWKGSTCLLDFINWKVFLALHPRPVML